MSQASRSAHSNAGIILDKESKELFTTQAHTIFNTQVALDLNMYDANLKLKCSDIAKSQNDDLKIEDPFRTRAATHNSFDKNHKLTELGL